MATPRPCTENQCYADRQTYLKLQYKSIALLHTNDKEAEKTIRETTIFTIATSNLQYLENIHF